MTRQQEIARTSQPEASEKAELPDESLALLNLGTTHVDLGQHEEAISVLERCLEISSVDGSHIRQVFPLLVRSYYEVGKLDAAWNACRLGRDVFSDDVELQFLEGMLSQRLGRPADAIRAYQAVLATREDRIVIGVDPALRGYKAHQNLAVIYTEVGRPDLAERHWRQVIAMSPLYKAGWQGLCGTLVRQGKHAAAEAECRRLLAEPKLRCLGKLLLAGVAWSRGDGAGVCRELDEAAAEFPDDPEVVKVRDELLGGAGEQPRPEPVPKGPRQGSNPAENFIQFVGIK